MKDSDLKYFELNNSVLDDFDKLMSMHLDYVEELKVSEIDTNSKLLNIISLCINIKTIIIEGDQRVNTNAIVSNICKPELLENLILKNVKVPSGHTLKKLSGLKAISLENIRFTNIGRFFKDIPEPEKIEEIKIYNSDFENNSIKIFEKFTNIIKIELIDVNNLKLENMKFLTESKTLEELTINNSFINIEEIDNFLEGNFKKDINCEIYSKENSKIKDSFEIDKEGKSSLTVNSVNLDKLKNVNNLSKLNKLTFILEKINNLDEYIKLLTKVQGTIAIIIKDVSQLTTNDARKLKTVLNIETIDILSIDEKNIENSYKMEDYIFIRSEIEQYCSKVLEDITDIEKFLSIYKLLVKEISIYDCIEEKTDEAYNLKSILLDKKCKSEDFCKVLQNVLACMKIENVIISGTLAKTNKNHRWNQVKLDNSWYNVDVALDCIKTKSNKILKKKFKYCLLGDKNFYETHLPSSGQQHYAENDFDRKTLKVYLKTGVLSNKLLKSYLTVFTNKFRRLAKLNKQKALPASTDDSDKDI